MHRTMRAASALAVVVSSALALIGCATAPEAERSQSTAPADATLRGAAPTDLLIGSAVAGGGHHVTQDYPDPFPNDEAYRELLASEFSSLTPENQLKWEFVHPKPDEYDFGPADAIVDFAAQNGQAVRASLFDLAGFMSEVEELLGVDVDVVSDRGTGPVMDRIRAEAVAL